MMRRDAPYPLSRRPNADEARRRRWMDASNARRREDKGNIEN